MTGRHTEIKIDPQKFADQVPKDDEDFFFFDEGDVLRYLVDEMNDAGAYISLMYHDGESIIEYQGKHDFFDIRLARIGDVALADPEVAVVDGMVELSNILNNFEGIKSWVSYQRRKYALHILHLPDVRTGINDALKDMTRIEIREAEDNIEAE